MVMSVGEGGEVRALFVHQCRHEWGYLDLVETEQVAAQLDAERLGIEAEAHQHPNTDVNVAYQQTHSRRAVVTPAIPATSSHRTATTEVISASSSRSITTAASITTSATGTSLMSTLILMRSGIMMID
jgi:hypothetical protein